MVTILNQPLADTLSEYWSSFMFLVSNHYLFLECAGEKYGVDLPQDLDQKLAMSTTFTWKWTNIKY